MLGRKALADHTLCDATRPEDATRTLREIKARGYFDSGFLSHLAKPVDLLFPSKEARICSCQINPHMCLHDLPKGSFRRLRPELYVLTPEVNFVQMGEDLSLAQLAAYGFELCGSYALAPSTERGFIDRPPLAFLDDLLRASSEGTGIRGAGKARAALAWVREGSRSPRETILVIVLCIPSDNGGYQLPFPQLNPAISLGSDAARTAGVGVLHPDLCWEEQKTIVEYDSDGTHLEEGQVIRDVDRKDAFARDGWHVITITNQRLWRPEVLDRIVREELAPRLGAVPPLPTPEFLAARRELRSELFGFDPYVPLRLHGRARRFGDGAR